MSERGRGDRAARRDAAAVAPTASAPARLASLSAFVPVHDEEASVVAVVEALVAVLPALAERWEVVVVDDGSRDATGRLVDGLAARDAHIRVVRHPRNRGYGAAVRSGLVACRHDVLFLIDGDGQLDPAELGRVLPLLADADAVVGRRVRRADPFLRRVAGAAWNVVVRFALGLRLRDVNCAFKLVRRSALAGVDLTADGACISAELLGGIAARGGRIVEVPVGHFPRRAGRASGGSARVVARAWPELVRIRRRVRAARRA
jgi:glycosyltransferase involved in cell wall biosynthesis